MSFGSDLAKITERLRKSRAELKDRLKEIKIMKTDDVVSGLLKEFNDFRLEMVGKMSEFTSELKSLAGRLTESSEKQFKLLESVLSAKESRKTEEVKQEGEASKAERDLRKLVIEQEAQLRKERTIKIYGIVGAAVSGLIALLVGVLK